MTTKNDTSNIDPDKLYNLSFVADFLGCQERFIREKLIQTNIIRAIKIGRKYAIKGCWLIDGLAYYDGDLDDD